MDLIWNMIVSVLTSVVTTVIIMFIQDHWLRIKAKFGDVYAQYNLGRNLRKGINGERPNRPEARKWLDKAAEKGHNNAQCSVGFMYLYGEGCEPNYDRAVYWFQKSAKQDNRVAQRELRRLGEKC